ncbi:MAG: PPC domain-containing protein [Planctomycetaceae bacterium]|nr:PPC domain-containing protein [Planctomycetaceae bacterium]
MSRDFGRWIHSTLLCGFITCIAGTYCLGQSVCLPAPRLLTVKPYGGKVGTTFDVVIAGEHIDDAEELRFSHPGITAQYKLDADGLPIANQYSITIAADCPLGVYEAFVMTRLGASATRAFSVGTTLDEVTQTAGNTSLEKAMPLPLNSICNGATSTQAVDFYSFEAKANQRVIVDCGAQGIDSKLNPVVIVSDTSGNDLLVERRGGLIEFAVPQDGTYVAKVHDLTFNGGPYYFYRLAVYEVPQDAVVSRMPGIREVSSFSWPPPALGDAEPVAEVEPNSKGSVQKVSLPCDIVGRFYPAADVDVFEFTAEKDETWWVEVASERLGNPTDPTIVVQQVKQGENGEELVDVAELTDIASPIKVSSNGYSYDGPPYNAGSADILAALTIKESGTYRVQLSDLFGGTRSVPTNTYRMVIRKAQPDFALVGWAQHMTLRNGDRNALSKPIALRGGTTMPFEVIVIRRDGFNDPIHLTMEGLPEGVTSTGFTIPAGKATGILLVTSEADAPRGMSMANLVGRAEIDGKEVIRNGHMASMSWPVPDAWSAIPRPRLVGVVPVSVCGEEQAPLTVSAEGQAVWEVKQGQRIEIPLKIEKRSEFQGNKVSLKTYSPELSGNPGFDISLDDEKNVGVVDLTKIKVAAGDYEIAFYGSAVAKYRDNPNAVTILEQALKQAQEEAEAAAKEVAEAEESTEDRKKRADAAVAEVQKQLNAAVARAKPKDIVDIVVSSPITIRVQPSEPESEK